LPQTVLGLRKKGTFLFFKAKGKEGILLFRLISFRKAPNEMNTMITIRMKISGWRIRHCRIRSKESNWGQSKRAANAE
jgi:hypothetical protein